jgi:hypothetical protein
VTASTELQPEEQLAELIKQAEIAMTAGDSKPHEWPPIINLSETKDYFFKSGSAELSWLQDASDGEDIRTDRWDCKKIRSRCD